MIILIAGASHTGKTVLAQKLLEKYKYPYLSIDHLKMGLIRSGNTKLTPEDDEELVPYLWPIVKEIIKTAIENHQNLVIEGLYIPFDWEKDFENEYLKEIQYYCLVMTKTYIENHFSDIKKHANAIESRMEDSYCTVELMIKQNEENLRMCKAHDCNYILIDSEYKVEIEPIHSNEIHRISQEVFKMENSNPKSFEYTYSAPQQEEIKKIREKYLPKDQSLSKLEQLRMLDKKAEKPGTILALILGIIGTLLFGLGMSCTMVMTQFFAIGIVVGIVGMAILSLAYPVYKFVTQKQREKIAPQILKMTEEIEK